MNKILTIKAETGVNAQDKIVWSYEITEHLFGQAPLTGTSRKEYDTEEEAYSELFETIQYILSGAVN
jgi:hypothetical protein